MTIPSINRQAYVPVSGRCHRRDVATKITVRNLGKSKLHHNLLSRIDCRNVQETLAL